MIKVKSFKRLRGNEKKYEIVFDVDGKTVTRKFGAAGMSDYTKHRDKERRERYISRHAHDLRTKDPTMPGYLSMYVLWNKPTVEGSLADYKKRLGVYNKTGKFPTAIAGSKLSFGTTRIDVLPNDVQDLIKQHAAASKIQSSVNPKKTLERELRNEGLRFYQARPGPKSARYLNTPTTVLDVFGEFSSDWMRRASRVLKKKDFDFVNRNLWWRVVEDQLKEMAEAEEDGLPEIPEYEVTTRAIVKMLKEAGYPESFDDNGPEHALRWWRNNRSSFGNKVPDNVVNKKLYLETKAKIDKSIKGRRWGAYDSGRLVREYKAAGGKYSGSKGKSNLDRWYKEKWVDTCAWPKRKPCGRKNSKSIAYCRPSVKVNSKTPKLVQDLTDAQIKARCNKKKMSPMKIITEFGARNVHRMRQQMYNEIMAEDDVQKGIQNAIIKRCGGKFVGERCERIFTELILSIFFTEVKNSKTSEARKANIEEMKKFVPKNFEPTMLRMKESQQGKVNEFLFTLGDHGYGPYSTPRVPSLVYEYINFS